MTYESCGCESEPHTCESETEQTLQALKEIYAAVDNELSGVVVNITNITGQPCVDRIRTLRTQALRDAAEIERLHERLTEVQYELRTAHSALDHLDQPRTTTDQLTGEEVPLLLSARIHNFNEEAASLLVEARTERDD